MGIGRTILALLVALSAELSPSSASRAAPAFSHLSSVIRRRSSDSPSAACAAASRAIGTLKLPPGIATWHFVDYTGKTIIPGLISDHSHVGIFVGLKAAPENYNRNSILRQLK
jgi:hypothetical protein